jgi:hypothetical protein
MAYYVDSALTYGAAVTATAMNVPAHEVNDILLMWVVINVNTPPTITTGTGWSAFTAETTNATNAGYWAWKRAASAAEAVSITTADDFTCAIHCIRDVDVTTAIDVSNQSGSASATSTPASVSATTTTADCLVLYLMSVGGIATAQHANPGVHHITSFDTGGTTDITTTTQGAAWYVQRAAGATPAPSWTCSLSGIYTRATIAFRNKSGGTIPAYIDDVSSPAAVVTPAHHYSTLNNISYTTTLTSTAAINGKTVTGLAGAAAADLGIVPFSNGISPAASTIARTALNGYQMTLTGNRNWSTGLIMGSVIGGTPKMGTFGAGTVKDGGFVIRLGSSATAWCAYQVAAKDAVPTLEVRSVWVIQPGYIGTSYGTPGTAVNASAISHMQFLRNTPYFSSQLVASEIYQVFAQVIAGGDSVNPVDTDGMASVGKSFRLPVIQKFGGYGLLSYAPIQIGGGDAVNFQINAGALQFPSRYNTVTKEVGFHAADNSVGISYAGKSGDVIKHTNSVITSPTSYYWNINAAATNAATWDFTGLVIVNAVVTLRNVMTFDKMSFSACSSLTFTGCTVTNSNISGVPATSASLVATSGAFSYLSINTTGLAAGNHLWTGADPTLFSYCAFTGSASSGHAMLITAAGGSTINLVGNTFNSYGANGSTSAALNFTASTGTITVNISGGGNTPTYKSAGAIIVINNTKIKTFTGLPSGTEVRVRQGSYTLAHDQDVITGSYAYNYNPDSKPARVQFTLPGYVFEDIDIVLDSTDQSLPVTYAPDPSYI